MKRYSTKTNLPSVAEAYILCWLNGYFEIAVREMNGEKICIQCEVTIMFVSIFIYVLTHDPREDHRYLHYYSRDNGKARAHPPHSYINKYPPHSYVNKYPPHSYINKYPPHSSIKIYYSPLKSSETY